MRRRVQQSPKCAIVAASVQRLPSSVSGVRRVRALGVPAGENGRCRLSYGGCRLTVAVIGAIESREGVFPRRR